MGDSRRVDFVDKNPFSPLRPLGPALPSSPDPLSTAIDAQIDAEIGDTPPLPPTTSRGIQSSAFDPILPNFGSSQPLTQNSYSAGPAGSTHRPTTPL